MKKRYFTVEEANDMVPFLEDCFTRIVQMRQQIRDIYQLLEVVDAAPSSNDFAIELDGASPAVIHNRATLKALLAAVEDEVSHVEATGCLVKGVDNGLVDWYAHRGGRDVFLCWHMGEKQVRYWHDTTSGIRGRRPIEEFFEVEDTEESTAESIDP